MPHQCTNCGRTFADGSKEMLSGCPGCGGNKFQFDPSDGSDGGTADAAAADTNAADAASDTNAADASDATASNAGAASDAESGATGTVDRARETVRDWVGADDGPTADASPADAALSDSATADGAAAASGDENAAQADARSGVVASDELPNDPPDARLDERPSSVEHSTGRAATDDGTVADTPDEERPDLAQLREELNEQFESIKIVQPGRYELNLMELYDRDEYIISLQEDGRYVIEVPETWRSDGE